MIVAGTILLFYNRLKNAGNGSKAISCTTPVLSWREIIKVSIFHIYLSFVLEFWALQYLRANEVIFLYSLTPFITGLLSYFLCKETISKRQIAGICIGFLAIIYGNEINMNGIDLAELILLMAIISGAYAWFIIQKLLEKGHSISIINGTSMLYGGILSLITWYFWSSAQTTNSLTLNWVQFFIWASLLIIISNIIIYNLYGYLIRRYSVTLMSFMGFLCPTFGTFFDQILYGSKIENRYLISIILLIIGLYLYLTLPRKNRYCCNWLRFCYK